MITVLTFRKSRMNILESVENRNKGNFNVNHPELRGGEIWLTNSSAKDFADDIGWKTKRAGEKAYTVNGEDANAFHPEFERSILYPVFVQRQELEDEENHD